MDIAVPFGLRRNPFGPALDPDQAFQSAPFVRAFDGVLEALHAGRRLIVVNGLPGSGKSLLLRALENSLSVRRTVARVSHAGAAHEVLDQVEVLLIDEADGIDDPTRNALIAAARDRGTAVVLACTGACLPGALTVPLSPLEPLEARAFIVDRLRRAGRPDLFDEAALETIVRAGDGLPQKLRLLAAGALTHAAVAETPRVGDEHARQAVGGTMLGGVAPSAPAPRPEPVEVRRRPAVTAAPVAAAAPIAAGPVAAGAAMAAREPRPMTPPAAPVPDRVPERAGWWASTPRLVRLGILVGLLLLSLPLLGYAINVMKDRPIEEETTAAIEEAPAKEVDAAAGSETETAEVLPPEPLPVPEIAVPDEPAGAPQDLLGEAEGLAETAAATDAAPVTEPREEARAPARTAEAPSPPPAPRPVEEPAAVGAGLPPRTEPPAPARTAGEPRLFVHYERGAGDAEDAASDVARGLTRDGFRVIDLRDVPDAPSRASVRYFFPEDRAAALEVAGMLADELREQGLPGDSELKAMTDYRPSPRRGTIEVWLPDLG